MNLANTLYMRMLNHRLQQQQLDQQNYQEAMQVANQNALETQAIEDKTFERNKELAKLQGETAAMNNESDPHYKDSELDPYAKHAKAAWRKKMAAALAEQQHEVSMEQFKQGQQNYRAGIPYSPEVVERKLGDDMLLDTHKRDNELRMRQALMQDKARLGLDETGAPLGFEKMMPFTRDVANRAQALIENLQIGKEKKTMLSEKLHGEISQIILEAGLLPEGTNRDRWALSKINQMAGGAGIEGRISQLAGSGMFGSEIEPGAMGGAPQPGDPEEDEVANEVLKHY